nr:hypothetical protein [Tanacetum cinerariifolium]
TCKAWITENPTVQNRYRTPGESLRESGEAMPARRSERQPKARSRARAFDDPILFLAGLQSSWEHGQQTNEEPAVEPMSEPATEPVNERVGTTVDLGGVPKEILLLFTLGVLFFEASCKKETGFWFVNLAHCRAKASAIKDDTPVLSIFDNDEGLEDCLELKDATACHLKISAITPPAWKDFLDNHLDVDLLDLHDRCYPRQAIMDNAVNR